MAEQLATIERIDKIYKHPNADKLSLVEIGNYKCIVGLDEYKDGDICILVRPDSVLPEQEWAIPYKKFVKGRIKATKIRDVWSFGLVVKPADVGIFILHPEYEVGMDVTDFIGITKFVNLEIENKLEVRRAGLPFSIPKTDEQNWRAIKDYQRLFGSIINITEKVDGQSFTAYYKDGDFGICSRTNDYKLDKQNAFTAHNERYNLQEKITKFCVDNKVNLAFRGESYGPKIQAFKINPYSKKPHGLAFFSVWNIDRMEYERIDSPFYIHKIAPQLGLPLVPMIEEGVEFNQELIDKYEKMEKLNGECFEGVVVQSNSWSCKIINHPYDSKK